MQCGLKLSGEMCYMFLALAVCDHGVQCATLPSPVVDRTIVGLAETLLFFCVLFAAMCLMNVLSLFWASKKLQKGEPKLIKDQ